MCRRNVFSSLQVPLRNVSLAGSEFAKRHRLPTSLLCRYQAVISLHKTPSEQVAARTRGDKATLDLPQSQPSRRKAASSCQATLSVSLQEVKSNRTLITFSSISPESQSYKRTVRLRLVQSLWFVPSFSRVFIPHVTTKTGVLSVQLMENISENPYER